MTRNNVPVPEKMSSIREDSEKFQSVNIEEESQNANDGFRGLAEKQVEKREFQSRFQNPDLKNRIDDIEQ